ncbi:MAG: signal recognition particle-docking protein FtsY [Candidatus Nanoarchaeia archaeon]|nr:signal recognition particle-docking protein FtsY [Candidatus Nanoarchaeia archaeon]
MFGFLKDKLKSAISSITKKIEKIPVEEKVEEVTIEKVPEKKVKKEKIKEVSKVEKQVKEEPVQEKKGFFQRIKEKVQTTNINESEFEEIFYDLELALLENNTAVEVIEKIKSDLKEVLVNKPIERKKIKTIIQDTLRNTVEELFSIPNIDILKLAKTKKPLIILFVGVNGSGKTTTISKVAHFLKENKLSTILVAADTFRAGSIQQLDEWGSKLGLKVIKQDYGSDPTAVAFDGKKYAEAHNIDVVLIDTAGRQHSNVNLKEEMKKIVRVIKPDLKIFIGESIVGNDAIIQAEEFNNAIELDGIILTKTDIDEKGGAALSISHVIKKPIIFLTTGQEVKDIKEFNKEDIIKNLGI